MKKKSFRAWFFAVVDEARDQGLKGPISSGPLRVYFDAEEPPEKVAKALVLKSTKPTQEADWINRHTIHIEIKGPQGSGKSTIFHSVEKGLVFAGWERKTSGIDGEGEDFSVFVNGPRSVFITTKQEEV